LVSKDELSVVEDDDHPVEALEISGRVIPNEAAGHSKVRKKRRAIGGSDQPLSLAQGVIERASCEPFRKLSA
jgi:hypothetical protein